MPEEKNNQPNTSIDVNTDVDNNKTPETTSEVSQTSVPTTTATEQTTEISQSVSGVPAQSDAPTSPIESVSPVDAEPIKTETEVAPTAEASPVTTAGIDMKPYFWAVIAIAVIGVGLLFALEKQGRVNTSFFGGATTSMSGPAATVNGVEISRINFDRNFEQALNEARAQGAPEQMDESMLATLREQAVQSLINAELLKQAAEEAGISISDSEVDERITEIENNNNGPEGLATAMAEFGLTMEELRDDIRRESLILAHLDAELGLQSLSVGDEELSEIYAQILEANEGQEIPPLNDIREMLESQILAERQQQIVGEYIEELRQTADIQINV